MAAMTNVPRLFDRALLRTRRDRLVAQGVEASFLRLEVAERLVDRLSDIRRPAETLLELGAQRGELRAGMVQAGIGPKLHVEAEPSLAMASQDAAGRLSVVAEDELLPFKEETFDGVLSLMSFHLVNDLPGTLAQIHRSLRQDGFLLAAFPGGESLQELRYCLTQAEIELHGGSGLRIVPFIDVRDAGALLQRAGFALPIADAERITVQYREPVRLLSDLREMGEANPMRERARAPLSRQVLVKALDIYRNRFGTAEGTVPATFDIIFLTGWKPHGSQPKPLRPGSGKTSLTQVIGAGPPAGSEDGGSA
jgi:NADH dehydrogenase [ubiquinone] 1 alpha subcomplex assembly factor 5